MRRSVAVVALAGGLLGASASAAEQVQRIGVFRDWSAYQVRDERTVECFIHSVPVESKGEYRRRGDVMVQVAHRPRGGVRDEVSFTAGYKHRSRSDVVVQIGARKFKLFAHEDRAYAPDAGTDQALATAMRKGDTMIVQGVSSRGTQTTDRYSLSGFSAAYSAIGRACR